MIQLKRRIKTYTFIFICVVICIVGGSLFYQLALDPGEGGGGGTPGLPEHEYDPPPISPYPDENGFTTIPGGNTLRYDWLTITMGDDDNDYLRHNVGGIDLISSESLGSTETNIDNTFIFSTRVTFGYEINSYLALSLRDVFPDLETNKWSSYTTYATIKLTTLTTTSMHYGKFRYSYVYLGTPDYHDYDVNIPMTIGINPTFSALDGKTIGGVSIKTSEYLYEVKSVVVVSQRTGTCGDYNDNYTPQPKLSDGVDTLTLDKTLTLSQTKVINKIAELNLGWETGISSEYVTEGITINAILSDAPSIGSCFTNLATGDLSYDYPLRLAPGITRTKQRIDVRTGGFHYISAYGTITQILPINSYSIYRDISAHATCPFVHQEYETVVYLISNVEVDAEIYESALNDPFFRKGDWLWDPIIDSYDPEILVPRTFLDDLSDWWDEYGWIIILVIIGTIGIYLFIQIGMPLLMLQLGRKRRY